MFKLLVKFPSRNRPQKFKSTVEQYVGGCSGKHHVRFVITMDEDDSTMNNLASTLLSMWYGMLVCAPCHICFEVLVVTVFATDAMIVTSFNNNDLDKIFM